MLQPGVNLPLIAVTKDATRASGNMRAEMQFTEHLSDESLQLLAESDRGCVLVAAAMVDEQIANLLRARFRHDERRIVDKMFTGTLPMLGSMWAKNILAYSLNLYSTRLLFDLIDCLRGVRNAFAHSAKSSVISRSHKAIDALLNKMDFALQPVDDAGLPARDKPTRDFAEVRGIVGGFDIVLSDKATRYTVSQDRFHFIMIVTTILERLQQLAADALRDSSLPPALESPGTAAPAR